MDCPKLVVQDLPEETASLEEQAESEIKILQAAELENQLAQVLEHTGILNEGTETSGFNETREKCRVE